MEKGNELYERRGHTRFPVMGHAFAMNAASQVACIMNISMGGLRLCYVDKDEWSREPFELDSLFGDDGLSLENVPCHLVFDTVLADEISELTLRQRGVRFGKMNPQQLLRLEQFIWNNSVNDAEGCQGTEPAGQAA